MADTILGIPNGVLTKGEQKIADPLFGPKTSTTDELLEKIRSSLEGTRRNTSPMRAVAEKQKEDFKNKGKLKVTASDMIRLSGPYSLGYMYLGDILRESTEGITERFTSGMEKLAPDKKTKKPGSGDVISKEVRKNSLFLTGLKKGLRDLFGLSDASSAEKKGGIFKQLLGGLFGGGIGASITKFVAGGSWVKAIPIAGLVVGLISVAIEGIRGALKAPEWGVSKLTGVVASVLGGTSSGWQGAFSNMGRWAGIGAGIGLVAGGPVGAIAGGFIGGALGGILGFIGGEKIAKAFKAVGEWVVTKWNQAAEGIRKGIQWIGDGILSIRDKIAQVWNAAIDWVISAWGVATAWVTQKFTDARDFVVGIGTTIWTFLKDVKDSVFAWIREKWDDIKTGVINIALGVKDFFVETYTKVASWISEKWNDLKTGFENIVTGVKDFFVETYTKVTDWVAEKWNDLKTGFENIVTGVKDFFVNTYTKITGWISEKWDDLKTGFANIVTSVKDFFIGIPSKIAEWVVEKWDDLKTGFGGIATGVKDFFTGIPAKIEEWAVEKWEDLKEGFFDITTKVKDWFSGTKVGEWGAEKAEDIKAGFNKITDGVKKWFADRDIDVSSLATDSVDKVKNFTSNMFSKVRGWFRDRNKEVEDEAAIKEEGLFSGLFSKVRNMFNFSTDDISPTMIVDLLKEKLVTPISNFFGNIGSFFEYLKSYFDDGIVGGISALATDIVMGKFNEGFEEFKKEQQVIINMPATPAPIQEPEPEDNRPWLKKLFRIEDGILKGNFELQRSMSRGSLFNNDSNSVVTDEGDDLYLMASTNPARDALTDSVDALNSMIERLAEAIEGYKPQINNTLAPVQNQESVLRSLLARG